MTISHRKLNQSIADKIGASLDNETKAKKKKIEHVDVRVEEKLHTVHKKKSQTLKYKTGLIE